MFVSGLPLVLRRAVCLAQNFSRCRSVRDTWKSGQCRAFTRKVEEPDNDEVKKPRPKTVPVPKITLVSLDNSTTVTVLEDAQRLAKRRNLTLVKINDLDSKTQRPIYKLETNTGIFEETEEDTKSVDRTDTTAQKTSKGTKLLYISAKITDHDLQTKTKNMIRLLNKGHKVKIVITLEGANKDEMQRTIEDSVKNLGTVQRMPSKKNVILLLINPLLKSEDVSVNNKDEQLAARIVNERDNT